MGTGHRSRLRRRVAAIPAALCLLLASAASAHAALTWRGPTGRDPGGSGAGLVQVACPSAATCAAITAAGGEITFNSQAPAYAAPVSVDSVPPSGLACPSATGCTAVDGSGREVSFNPASPGGASPTTIDPGQSLTSVACPEATLCAAIDAIGGEVTYNPTTGANAGQVLIDSSRKLTAITCPSATVCVAIDSGSDELSFNPGTPGVPRSATVKALVPLESGTSSLTALTCLDAHDCLAFDNAGHEIPFDPQPTGTPAPPTPIQVDSGAGASILAATCPSPGRCVALDAGGNEVSFTPGQGSGTPGAIDPQHDLAALACPDGCVAVDGHGHADAFPVSGPPATTTLIDAQVAYSTVACPSAAQCTAMDSGGGEATFDPTELRPSTSASVDPAADIVYGISCPIATQCTAVDDLGHEVTFNPLAPGSPRPVAVVAGHALLAVSCPAATQCTAVDDDRYAATFNPQDPVAASYADLNTPVGTSLVAVDCPASDQCVALDGAGHAVSFNPHAPGSPVPVAVLPGPGVALSCVSTTECVALDASGVRATFVPGTRPGATAAIDSQQPATLSCSTPTYCVALDTTGRAAEFDPRARGAAAVRPVGDAAQLTGLSCPAPTACVAVDMAGAAYVGAQPASAPPVLTSPPRIAGRPQVGRMLTASPGAWLGDPTSYAISWQRCHGGGCRPIPGASGARYTPQPADAGQRLRVVVAAANPFGAARPVLSRLSAPVLGRPAAPALSHVAVTGLSRDRPRLTLRIVAARYGPSLLRLTLRLGPGLRLARRLPRGTVIVSGHGRPIGVRVRVSRGALEVSLRRRSPAILVTIAWPALSVTRVARRSARRRGRRSRLTLSVSVPDGRRALRSAPAAVAVRS